jgi:hypothetical protein
MGRVFRAKYVGSDVVVKETIPKPGLEEEFLREIEIASQLHHRHVAGVLGACRDPVRCSR